MTRNTSGPSGFEISCSNLRICAFDSSDSPAFFSGRKFCPRSQTTRRGLNIETVRSPSTTRRRQAVTCSSLAHTPSTTSRQSASSPSG
ncbi:MAG: hypothetical protein U1F77_11485 [Kiritimatiellia bacterium]